ncbi:MAG TPA: DUF881 domain-containing protein [Streptosporangiaceae bacterium]|nr:DUF881 domain-containing protein [Streptosporangiaceae bacterium]
MNGGDRDDAEPVGGDVSAAGRVWALLRPRAGRGQLLACALCLLLGFAVAAQVTSNRADTTFGSARQDELVGILSDVTERSDRLRADIRELEDTKARLERDGRGAAALEEARRRATAYGILAGTLPATGPGIELLIDDPGGRVRASVLLDTVQELRDAGAEVIQVNDVRAGVDSYFLDAPGRRGIDMDGTRLTPPYLLLVIGDPHTLATALNIPGGVLKTLRNAGANGLITQREKVAVRAVRS